MLLFCHNVIMTMLSNLLQCCSFKVYIKQLWLIYLVILLTITLHSGD